MPLDEGSKNAKTDKQLVLQPMEGRSTLSSMGLTDNRLFTGEVELHAVMDDATCLWNMKYSKGIPPQAFNQRFTSFNRLLRFAKDYFAKRNVEIIRVIE